MSSEHLPPDYLPPEILPLFPLGVVVFPRAPLQLYIFEDRYKQMMLRCLADNVPFAILLVEDGKVSRIGTTCSIEEVLQSWPDGRLRLAVRGVERIEVTSFNEDEEYLQATWRSLPDQEEPFSKLEAEQLIEVYERFARLKAQGATPRDLDAEEEAAVRSEIREARLLPEPGVSFDVLAQLVLDAHDKQRYLEITSETERVKRLLRQLTEGIIALSRFYRLRAMLGANGFLPPEGPEWEYFRNVDYL